MAVGLDIADFIVMLSQLSISVRDVSSSLNCIDPIFFFFFFLMNCVVYPHKNKNKNKGL